MLSAHLHSNITFIFINIEAILFKSPSSFPITLFSVPFSNSVEMAKTLIYGIVQTIIENLGSQILQEIGKILNFKNELEKLDKTVSRI